MSNRTKVVCAVIRNEAGAYLATQRGSGHYEGLWEFPGGKVEPKESIVEATERELREELDVVVKAGDVLLTNVIELQNKQLELVFIAAQIVSGDIQLNEHAAFRWLLPSQLNDVVWLPGDIPMVDRLAIT
ncbi:(deoxy)nucleoside triphosphate pyrophosphohydrolase [Flavobacteriales bacterium]|nr:(deoxy)nucleoside triphosphate pyrophosphohydrolase [Flavobacteriales bacterium]